MLYSRREIEMNLFADLPNQLPEELYTTLLSSPSMRIERIVSHGHASPEGYWYDQHEHEWVIVLAGAARLRFEQGNRVLDMKPGDYINIPAGQRHRVDWTTSEEPTVWLALFYAPALVSQS